MAIEIRRGVENANDLEYFSMNGKENDVFFVACCTTPLC